jgi:hypothetical protein
MTRAEVHRRALRKRRDEAKARVERAAARLDQQKVKAEALRIKNAIDRASLQKDWPNEPFEEMYNMVNRNTKARSLSLAPIPVSFSAALKYKCVAALIDGQPQTENHAQAIINDCAANYRLNQLKGKDEK